MSGVVDRRVDFLKRGSRTLQRILGPLFLVSLFWSKLRIASRLDARR